MEGLFASKGFSKPLLEHFKTRNVYSYELINHLDSTRWQDDMSYEAMALDLLRFADEVGLKRFTLSGICIGARVAMRFAGMFPERIDGLIVYEASIGSFDLPYVHTLVECLTAMEKQPREQCDIIFE